MIDRAGSTAPFDPTELCASVLMAAAAEEPPFAFLQLRFPNLLLRSSYRNQLSGFIRAVGYTVVTKPAKEFDDGGGRRKFKRSMHIEIAVAAMELADKLDQIVLFSGDGDFRSLVEPIQRRGVHVTVVSSNVSQPPMIADELRRQADVFIDLVELRSKIGRDPSDRPASQEIRHSIPRQ